jgi:hypothetical protein
VAYDLAWALGFAHPDILRAQLSRSQWLGWLQWMVIRGPIGPQRNDYYTSFISRFSGGTYPADTGIEEFAMPWDESNPDKYRQ